MKTKFLSFFRLKILVVFFMQVAVIQAQDNYQTQMDVIFDIPSYKITTGVLINRSPNILEIQDFKLQSDSSSATVTNVINWFELFYRLYSSHLNLSGFSYDNMLAHKYLGKTVEGQINLGLIFYQYNKIVNNLIINPL